MNNYDELSLEDESEMLMELSKRGQMKSIENVLPGITLADFQTFVVALCLIRKKQLISMDTGLGKTLVAAAIIRLIPTEKKWLFICQDSNIIQTTKKLAQYLPDKFVQMCTSDPKQKSAFFALSGTTNVHVLTYQSFCNEEVNKHLFSKRKEYVGLICDESHTIGNEGSNASTLLKHMLRKNFEYQFFLTATPLRVDIFQILNQINMIDPVLVPDPQNLAMRHTIYDATRNAVGYHDIDELSDIIMLRYISVTRADLGIQGDYHSKLQIVPQNPNMRRHSKPEDIKLEKSSPDNYSIRALWGLVSRYMAEGKKGLVYANLEIYKSEILRELGSRCSITRLDGTLKKAESTKVQEEFNSGKYDVLVSNITEGRDLSCDYIIFYEQTVNFKQFIGRGERGIQGKDLDIIFLLIKDSYDLQYFYKNVYKRGLILEKLCGKNIKELKDIKKQIEKNTTDSWILEDCSDLDRILNDEDFLDNEDAY